MVKMQIFRHKMTPDILEKKANSAGISHITDTCTILNYHWTPWLTLWRQTETSGPLRKVHWKYKWKGAGNFSSATSVNFRRPVSWNLSNWRLGEINVAVFVLTINRQIRIYFSGSRERADIIQMIINLMLGGTADKIVSDAPDTALGKICVHRDARIHIFNQQSFMLYSEMETLYVNDITSNDRYN